MLAANQLRSAAAALVVAFACVTGLLCSGRAADAQSLPTPTPTASGPTLRVAVKPVPPFAMQQDGDTWSGFSIDLWRAVAQRHGWAYTWVGMDTVDQQLDALRNGTADAGIAAISVPSERE